MTSRFAREIIFSASIIAILLCPFVGMLNSTVSKDESVALKGDRSLLKLDVEQASRSLRDWPTLQSYRGFSMMHWIRSLEEMRVDEPPLLRTSFQGDVLVYDNPLDQRNPRMVYDDTEKRLWMVFAHHNVTDDIYLANSDDLGQTWTTYAIASNQSYNESNPAIAMFGATIMIVYEQDRIGGEQHTHFIRSQDRGQNWNDYYINWDWTNQPGYLQLEDFNNPDLSISQVDWFHWTMDAFGVRNNTRTVAFMWTEDDGDSWWMVYWTATWHMGEDFERPVIMENMADNYMHMAYQHWNITEAGWDIEWLIVDHGLTDVWGWWTANLDGGNSEISPDICIRDDIVLVIWQNGTSTSDLTAFYSDDGAVSSLWILYLTMGSSWNETFPSCAIDTSYALYIAYSNDTVTYYGTTMDPLSPPHWEMYVVSENSSTTHHPRLLDIIPVSDTPAVTWTDLRNTNADVYFSMALVSNRPPVAIAKPSYQEVLVGDTAWLYGNDSYDPDGFIVNYSWWIEGPSGVVQLFGDIVSFVPTQEGMYLANLTVRDNGSLEDSARAYVNAITTEPKQPPVADAGDNKVVFMWEVVTFNGGGSYDPDGFIVDYFWYFGDGGTANGMVVDHTYVQVGEYYVTLTVTDNDNLTDTDTIVVIVLDPRPDPPDLLRAILTGSNHEDILIEWELSFDDGDGFNDVINYAVYWSDTYDTNGAGYRFLTELAPGTTSLTLSGWGDSDWSNYFFYVQANDTDGYTNWKGQAGKFVRFLEAGKRIASIPLVQDDETLETVLQSLDGSYNHVRYYKSSDQGHHWKSYWTFKKYRTLYDINHRMGFWIQITKDDHLVVAGLVPGITEIELGHGWNFVGYPCFTPMPIMDALADVDYKMVDGYSDTPPYHLTHLIDSDMMTTGDGYWVWVDLPQTWIVPN